MIRTLLVALLIITTTSAHAVTCAEVQTIIADVGKADTKQAVADALERAGAPKDLAENMALASPDVEVAQITALRSLNRLSDKLCTKS